MHCFGIYILFIYEDVDVPADDHSMTKKAIKRLYFGPLASRRRGIGKLLVQYAEAYAKEQGCCSVDIKVINVRHDVLPWYQRQQYVIYNELPYPKPETCTRDVHFLCLRKTIE